MVILRILLRGLIPVTLLTCFYTKIFLKIREHKQNMASQNTRAKNKMIKEQRMAITFAGVVLSYLVCTIPGCLVVIQVYMVDGGELKGVKVYDLIIIVRDVLYTLNSSINIFIYSCLDTIFRKELKKFFMHLMRRHVNSPTSTECETAC